MIETPLFRVRTGKSGSHQQETIHCYSEAERDAAAAKLSGGSGGACILPASGTGAPSLGASSTTEGRQDARPTERIEITCFKGLGEISPNEFKQFIGKECA